MLEVIQSDFARLQAETINAEHEAHKSHLKFVDDTEADRAAQDYIMRHKGYRRDSTLRILRETNNNLYSTQKMLTAALEYYEKLKPDCEDTGLSYKERVERRQEEIQSLQEALRILEGEDLSPAP